MASSRTATLTCATTPDTSSQSCNPRLIRRSTRPIRSIRTTGCLNTFVSKCGHWINSPAKAGTTRAKGSAPAPW
ncbi:hypothetical protein [Lysobacter gummosus]|uniref:hypothetical protein n=1 Tax=Lysobacter gummosus TaxID=262324 RepID=UPI00363A1066